MDYDAEEEKIRRMPGGRRTELCYPLWHAWARAAEDPDTEVPEWLRSGAPAGISCHPRLCNIFPAKEPSQDPPPKRRKLATFHQGHRNYASVEEDTAAEEEIKKLAANSAFIKTFTSYADTCAFLNAKPIISKLAMITKVTPTKVKRRLILDCLRSAVNEHTIQWERGLLPYVLDVIADILELMMEMGEGTL